MRFLKEKINFYSHLKEYKLTVPISFFSMTFENECCGSQSPQWSLIISISWYSDLSQTREYCETECVTSKVRSKTLWVLLCSLLDHLLCKQRTALLWEHCQPYVEVFMARIEVCNQQPALTCHSFRSRCFKIQNSLQPSQHLNPHESESPSCAIPWVR